MRLDQRGARDQRGPPGGGAEDRHHRPAHRGRAHGAVRPRGRRGVRPRARVGAAVPRPGAARARARRDPRRRRVGRLGLRRGGPGVRRAVRPDRGHLRRPERRGDAPARRQDRRQAAGRGGRRPGGAVVARSGRRPRVGHRARGADRLPADAQGDRGRGWARHPRGHHRRRARGRLRAHPRGGPARVRQRRGLPRAARHRRPARRGAGHLRRRDRVGARRPRLLGAAPQPEGDRGERLARPAAVRRRAAEGVGRAAGRPGRVPRCRHGRVPLPPGRRDPGVPRGQHPAAGRAPDHRAHHRLRPGEGAAARGCRREAGGLPAARARATPSRPG